MFAWPCLLVCALKSRNKAGRDLVWGNEALLNYGYWAEALHEVDRPSYVLIDRLTTPIYKRAGRDLTFDELVRPALAGMWLWQFFRHYVATAFVIKNAAVFHF